MTLAVFCVESTQIGLTRNRLTHWAIGTDFDVPGLSDFRSIPDLHLGWERRENYRFSLSRCSMLRPLGRAVFDLALECGSSGALATRRGWKGLHRSYLFCGLRRRGVEL